MNSGESNVDFSQTNWRALAALQNADPDLAHQALNDLCKIYWPPLYAFARRNGHTSHDAEDLVQGLLQRLFDRGAFRTYAPTAGIRFRTWLITCLKRFEVDEWRKDGAVRRGGRVSFVSLDLDNEEGRAAYELPATSSPEHAYEASMGRLICERSFRRLEAEQVAAGFGDLYRELAPTLLETRMAGILEVYHRLAGKLGMTAQAVAKRKERLRTRFGEILREEVGRLVATQEEIDDELRRFLAALG